MSQSTTMPMPMPMPSGGTPMNITPAEMERFDAPLIALANLAGGDLRKLFTAFFSFLNRRTDFYSLLPEEGGDVVQRNMGFREGQAERILLASFRQFPLRRVPPADGKRAQPRLVAAPPSSGGAAAKKSPNPSTVGKKSTPPVPDATDAPSPAASEVDGGKNGGGDCTGGGRDGGKEGGATKSGATSSSSSAAAAIRHTPEGKQIPVGNGGSTSQYVWTQNLEEVTVLLPVPPGTRGKDLTVKIGANSLSLARKNAAAATDDFVLNPVGGTLFAKIRPSESTWSLESDTLIITLDKYVKTWWGTVLSGDPEIDNTLVDSTRRIDTYDEATQAQIRRIMFDQRQERLGLPSSEELSGETPKVPPLPSGVEYIDSETLNKASSTKK